MKAFAEWIIQLEQTQSTLKKVSLLRAFFESDTDERDKIWTLALFTGKKPPRSVNTSLLRKWSSELAQIPSWLFEQNYYMVGDLAETIALLVSSDTSSSDQSLYEWIEQIYSLRHLSDNDKEVFVKNAWQILSVHEVWIFNKIITGGFRIGVSKSLVIQALSQALKKNVSEIAYMISGKWTPFDKTWTDLFKSSDIATDTSKPYPFFLSYSVQDNDISHFNPAEWAAEYKWDGMRAQLIYREDNTFIWSRGEELITDKFPELHIFGFEKDFVLDGEILVWTKSSPRPFSELQPRISRKKVTRKMLDENPVVFIAYDIMEFQGKDVRHEPLEYRRTLLEGIISEINLEAMKLSPWLSFTHSDDLKQLRKSAPGMGAEGLMLKRKKGIYHTGRKTGDMFKWKCDPFLTDAVLIYAQRGHGRRTHLFSDFTFGIWNEGTLVPFAKAYSGLTDQEIKEITQWVKRNTIQSFGPVVSVEPQLVFELAFENITFSKRHKSGISVRFPRISRWRRDKKAEEADTLNDLITLMKSNR